MPTIPRPRHTTTAGIAVLVAVLIFAWLGHAAVSGMTYRFDARILLALRQSGDLAIPRGPQWLFRALRDITALGDTPVLTLVTVVAAGLAVLRRRVGMAVFIAVTVAVGAILDTQMKLAFARPRPSVVPHLVEVTSASFPSGHAMNSTIVYLTLAALLARQMPDRRSQIYIGSVGIALALVIGASRVYLGVHYPTDVVGGWLAGAAWALACWLVASRWLAVAMPGGVRAEALPSPAHPAKAREP